LKDVSFVLFNAHKGIDNVVDASNVIWFLLMNVRAKFIMEKNSTTQCETSASADKR